MVDINKEIKSSPDDIVPVEKKNTFSVIIATCERRNLVQRAIRSVQDQLYAYDEEDKPLFEIIVVNDGSSDDTKEVVEKMAKKDSRITLINHEGRQQRCAARNTGMRAAKNKWICWLDSDDEYVRTYLNSMNWAINEYPDYKIFHFGALVCTLRNYRFREAAQIEETEEGMQRFQSGGIGAGSFIFRRKLLKEVGYLPIGEKLTPYSFADAAKEEMPEIVEFYGPKYMDGGREMGNPWGDDWYMFYKLTRKNKSKALPFYTYLHYIRRGGFIVQDDDLKLNR